MRARKRFGQHFLQDKTIIEKMIRSIHPMRSDNLLEIGPGLGALTFVLLPFLDKLDVVEFDRDLIPTLEQKSQGMGQLRIHQADALSFNFAALNEASHSLRVVGNLPYNISTPLLFHLLTQLHAIKDMHFMLQKEVVDRIAAVPGSRVYGRLSVMIQYHCDAQILFEVPPQAFHPIPRVMSAVLRLLPREPQVVAKDLTLFAEVVRLAFNQRRKMLQNSLAPLCSLQAIQALDINPQARPEQIAVDAFVRISNSLIK